MDRTVAAMVTCGMSRLATPRTRGSFTDSFSRNVQTTRALEFPRTMHRALSGLCLLVSLGTQMACESSIPLAGDCAPLGRTCQTTVNPERSPDGDGATQPGSPHDAGQDAATDTTAGLLDGGNDASALAEADAGPADTRPDPYMSDAAVELADAGTASDGGAEPTMIEGLPISNPSFERTDGMQGRSALSYMPGLSNNGPLHPWIACRPWSWTAPWADMRDASLLGGTVTGDPDPDERLEPTDGDAVLETGFTAGGYTGTELTQELAAPLDPSMQYAWLVDLAAVSEAEETIFLELKGSDGSYCWSGWGGSISLATSPLLRTADGWTTVCLTFRPTEAHTHITLAPRSTRSFGNSDDRLFIDNFRPAPEGKCPEGVPTSEMGAPP